MSPLAEAADVKVLLADYASIDAGGKVNLIGATFTVTSLVEQAPGVFLVAPQCLMISITLPARYLNKEFSLSVELRDEHNSAVTLPAGPGQPPQALRIQQNTRVPSAAQPLASLLPEDMFNTTATVINLANGMPLPAGHTYTWRVEIDGRHRQPWRTSFHVVRPPAAPVVGGPSSFGTGTGPADIPDPFVDDPRQDNDDMGDPSSP